MRWVDIPAYWKWYAYIDFLRYGWGALMINQVGDGLRGGRGWWAVVRARALAVAASGSDRCLTHPPTPRALLQFKGTDAVIAGQPVLEYYSLQNFSDWEFIGYLVCFWAFFTLAAWAALTYKKHGAR